jgi:hypothetical protein
LEQAFDHRIHRSPHLLLWVEIEEVNDVCVCTCVWCVRVCERERDGGGVNRLSRDVLSIRATPPRRYPEDRETQKEKSETNKRETRNINQQRAEKSGHHALCTPPSNRQWVEKSGHHTLCTPPSNRQRRAAQCSPPSNQQWVEKSRHHPLCSPQSS